MARVAITSLAFMFVEVPEPVWKTSTTNWSSNFPSATSRAACSIAFALAVGEQAELRVGARRGELDRAPARG